MPDVKNAGVKDFRYRSEAERLACTATVGFSHKLTSKMSKSVCCELSPHNPRRLSCAYHASTSSN
jgi:hypothetical protein